MLPQGPAVSAKGALTVPQHACHRRLTAMAGQAGLDHPDLSGLDLATKPAMKPVAAFFENKL